MKLKNMILMLVLGVGLIVVAFAIVGAHNLSQLGEQLQTSTMEAERYADALNVSRSAQVGFQRQIQEWKNILIRGNDRESYKKYLDGFVEQERNVQAALAKLGAVFATLKRDSADVYALVAEHKILGDKYRQALVAFDPADRETGKKVDNMLRGIDRASSKAMDVLADKIEQEATTRLTTARNEAVSFAETRILLFAIMAILSITFTIGVCWKIGFNILKLVGAEPAELVKIFTGLAQGQLNQEIALKEGDETSMAAQATLMQMRVRAMVVSIQQGVTEFSAAASLADKGASPTAIQDALREARKSIVSLNKAADRFKVKG